MVHSESLLLLPFWWQMEHTDRQDLTQLTLKLRLHSTPTHKTHNNRIFVNLHPSIQGPALGYIKLHLRGLDIKNVEPGLLGLGRSDPFFEIAKKNSDHAAGIVRW